MDSLYFLKLHGVGRITEKRELTSGKDGSVWARQVTVACEGGSAEIRIEDVQTYNTLNQTDVVEFEAMLKDGGKYGVAYVAKKIQVSDEIDLVQRHLERLQKDKKNNPAGRVPASA